MKFKDILAWIKGHLIIVVSCVLILVILPVAAFFSMRWHGSIVKAMQTRADAELAKTKVSVTYALPQVDPKVPAVTQSGAPNEKLTAFFSKTREQMLAEVERLAKKGENFNKGSGPQAQGVGRSEFVPMVEGLYPKVVLTAEQAKGGPLAQREQEQIRLNDMEDALLGKNGRPNPYQALLAKVRAGTAPDAERVEAVLKDLDAREREKITAGNREMTPEESERLRTLLKERRLGEYQAVARGLGVYADMSIFPTDLPVGGTGGQRRAEDVSAIPTGAIPPRLLSRERTFIWQWDLWAMQDLFSAINLANTDASGAAVGVDRGVVKRILAVQVLNPAGLKPLASEVTQQASEFADPGAVPEAEAVPNPPIDRKKSVVGWIRSGGNSVYEVRAMRVRLIASSARLGEFIDALQRTNFIAVTDLDMRAVDSWDHLGAGYFYGDEHVVDVTMTIESAWLTSWLLPLMPPELQVALGRTPAAEPAPADGASGPN